MENKNSWLMQVLQIPVWFAILWALVTYARPAVSAYSAGRIASADSANNAEAEPEQATEAEASDHVAEQQLETKYVSTPSAEVEDADSQVEQQPISFSPPPRRKSSSAPQATKQNGTSSTAPADSAPNNAADTDSSQKENETSGVEVPNDESTTPQPSADEVPKDAIVINNPTKYTISFKVDGIVKTVKPGQSYQADLVNRDSFRVSFDRGGRFGTSSRLLKAGSYNFGVTESGWQLLKVEE